MIFPAKLVRADVLSLLPLPTGAPKEPGAEYYDAQGHCRPWCEQMHDDQDTHGPWCTSSPRGGITAEAINGQTPEVWASLVAPYEHGRYKVDPERSRKAYRQDICLFIGETPETEEHLFINSAEARKIAAALTFLADQADMLDRPLREVK